MLVGYMRVSKVDGSQVLDLQQDALREAGVEEQYIYKELMSGAKEDRPILNSCLKALRPGDTLVVWKLDRLGRSLKQLVQIVDDLQKREVGFRVLTGQGAQIDTTTPSGRLIFGIFATLAEYERELIRERTLAGLSSARSRGRSGGRPRKIDKATLQMVASALRETAASPKEIAKKFGVHKATLYLYLNGDGSLKAAGEKLMI